MTLRETAYHGFLLRPSIYILDSSTKNPQIRGEESLWLTRSSTQIQVAVSATAGLFVFV